VPNNGFYNRLHNPSVHKDFIVFPALSSRFPANRLTVAARAGKTLAVFADETQSTVIGPVHQGNQPTRRFSLMLRNSFLEKPILDKSVLNNKWPRTKQFYPEPQWQEALLYYNNQ